jgi:hypothetical protein
VSTNKPKGGTSVFLQDNYNWVSAFIYHLFTWLVPDRVRCFFENGFIFLHHFFFRQSSLSNALLFRKGFLIWSSNNSGLVPDRANCQLHIECTLCFKNCTIKHQGCDTSHVECNNTFWSFIKPKDKTCLLKIKKSSGFVQFNWLNYGISRCKVTCQHPWDAMRPVHQPSSSKRFSPWWGHGLQYSFGDFMDVYNL